MLFEREWQQIKHTPEASKYLVDRLSRGRSLSKAVLQAKMVEHGPLYVSWTKANALDNLDFVNGTVDALSGEPASISDAISDYLLTAGKLVIFEHQLATKGDPWISAVSHHGNFSYSNSDVYIWLASEDLRDREEFYWQGRRSWNSLGFLCAGVNLGGDELTQEKLEELARDTEIVAVEAFDGDGFVLWDTRQTRQNAT